MTRSVVLSDEVQNYDFERLAKLEKDSRKKLRLLGLAHVKENRSCESVGKMLKVAGKTVTNWVKRFNENGIDGLNELPGRGRKPMLPKEKFADFSRLIEEESAKLKGGRLFGEDIRRLLKEKFNVECSLTATYDILHRTKHVWISARSRHPQSKPEVQEDFKRSFADSTAAILKKRTWIPHS
jgi:transposase